MSGGGGGRGQKRPRSLKSVSHILQGFLKICLIDLVKILVISAKMATPGLLKITIFRNKGYDVITFLDDVTNKVLLMIQVTL